MKIANNITLAILQVLLMFYLYFNFWHPATFILVPILFISLNFYTK
jgi:hypothetical protein